jgi:hypothetical protein
MKPNPVFEHREDGLGPLQDKKMLRPKSKDPKFVLKEGVKVVAFLPNHFHH